LHGVLFSIAVNEEQLRSTVIALDFDLEAIATSGAPKLLPIAKLVRQAENNAIAINVLVLFIEIRIFNRFTKCKDKQIISY
jgi:hypothetical protein